MQFRMLVPLRGGSYLRYSVVWETCHLQHAVKNERLEGEVIAYFKLIKKSPWSESASELYRPSDSRLSAKRLPTCADRGCHVVSVTDPSGRILSVF
jgi:hypothetical protein